MAQLPVNPSEPVVSDDAAGPKIAFLGTRYRKLHIALAVLTVGVWLLALLSVWLWKTGRRRGAYISGSIFALLVVLVAVGVAQGGKTAPSPTSPQSAPSSSPKLTTITSATRAIDDAYAKAAIGRALKDVASNYQDFGSEVFRPRKLIEGSDEGVGPNRGLDFPP